jgi:hypothetical protein
MTTHDYIYHGTMSTAGELVGFVEHLLRSNAAAEAEGRRKTPVCIWGRHGIGKTEIVEQIAQKLGYRFSYIAPAQFEEMGDLVGMPAIDGGVTTFRPPAWVPTEEGPGILLIDDVNRADDRILRGIMQLLQNFELVSWRMPPKWQILLTANPDGGDYSVTPMDNAMLTRLMHISMQFDVKEWAKWADGAGVDPRGINFILTYPEMVTGERTTPRSLVQFFESIRSITDLRASLGLVRLLADSCLDEATVRSFITFVNQGLSELISPEEILDAKDFDRSVAARLDKLVHEDTLRVDILTTVSTRLVNYLLRQKGKLSKDQLENIKSFIKLEFLPNDIRLTMAQDLVTSDQRSLKPIMADPAIAKLLLRKM